MKLFNNAANLKVSLQMLMNPLQIIIRPNKIHDAKDKGTWAKLQEHIESLILVVWLYGVIGSSYIHILFLYKYCNAVCYQYPDSIINS